MICGSASLNPSMCALTLSYVLTMTNVYLTDDVMYSIISMLTTSIDVMIIAIA